MTNSIYEMSSNGSFRNYPSAHYICAPMSFQDWLQLLQTELVHTTWPEWIAVIFGVAQVLLAQRNHVLTYPAGIISIVLSIYILTVAVLYAEALLNIYYLVMSIYGWYLWSRKTGKPLLPVTFTTRKEWNITALIVVGGWIVLYAVLRLFTTSDVPVWDAWVSATAWAGMWLLARRKVENWLLLNLSNLFAVPLQFYKHLPLFALLTVVLFVVACFGYFDWRKIAKKAQPVPRPEW